MNTTQQGAALLTALIILVAVTLLSLASLGTSLLQLRMSGNEEMSMQAFELAQAGIDYTVSNHENMVTVVGDIGFIRCTSNYTDTCHENSTLTIPLQAPFLDSGNTNKHSLAIEKVSEGFCPPRGMDLSCDKAKAAAFTIRSRYNKVALGQGLSDITQGFIKPVPSNGAPPIEPITASNN
ncbi:MAG: pilus assembly PilX N-terminal domain-containing protein [Gammaproteobacteria bacterium]|nr:pilus assembly PilX N-terminal domain-containing protein [Gammaproteobacteria bacterium]